MRSSHHPNFVDLAAVLTGVNSRLVGEADSRLFSAIKDTPAQIIDTPTGRRVSLEDRKPWLLS